MDSKLGYLSLEIICSSKLTVFLFIARIAEYVFAPNGGCCFSRDNASMWLSRFFDSKCEHQGKICILRRKPFEIPRSYRNFFLTNVWWILGKFAFKLQFFSKKKFISKLKFSILRNLFVIGSHWSNMSFDWLVWSREYQGVKALDANN